MFTFGWSWLYQVKYVLLIRRKPSANSSSYGDSVIPPAVKTPGNKFARINMPAIKTPAVKTPAIKKT